MEASLNNTRKTVGTGMGAGMGTGGYSASLPLKKSVICSLQNIYTNISDGGERECVVKPLTLRTLGWVNCIPHQLPELSAELSLITCLLLSFLAAQPFSTFSLWCFLRSLQINLKLCLRICC